MAGSSKCQAEGADADASPRKAIKTMKLYSHVDRVTKFLEKEGYGDSSKSVPRKILSKYDNLSYVTEESFQEIAAILELTEDKRLLDLGCGIAGPMRSVADVSGCNAVGIELQADLAQVANELSARCGMKDRCSVHAGDFLKMDLAKFQETPFDALKSLLVVLHIPVDLRPELFKRVKRVLKSGAKMCIEDYVKLQPELSAKVSETLRTDIYAAALPTMDEYRKQLEDAGFADIEIIDRTAIWTKFVSDRRDAFIAKREQFVEIQGEDCFDSLLHFYNAVVSVFKSNEVGGVRIVARVP